MFLFFFFFVNPAMPLLHPFFLRGFSSPFTSLMAVEVRPSQRSNCVEKKAVVFFPLPLAPVACLFSTGVSLFTWLPIFSCFGKQIPRRCRSI